MAVQAIWLIVPLALVVLGIVAGRLVSTWLRYRGARLITCPENRRPAGVRVDDGHAALTALKGTPELRLASCSRWPERAGCGQGCLAQIEAAPEDCLIRNILADWYRGKVCASCGRPFGEIRWTVQKPGLISADKISVEWNQLSPERLRETLETALPVCFGCHMASTLVREHPELALDRGAGEARRISS
jgi:hypothetical protein